MPGYGMKYVVIGVVAVALLFALTHVQVIKDLLFNVFKIAW